MIVVSKMRSKGELLIVIPESNLREFNEKGGFAELRGRFAGERRAAPLETLPTPVRASSGKLSLSQPCLPVCSQGPTKILPFLYLGSQQDAMDKDVMKSHGIDYVLNLSTNCPRPEFLQEEHFLRIPVNDSYAEKLLPHFELAFQFLEKVREADAAVLVHCLAGISRSPTLAIAYIMRHLHMTFDEAYRYVKQKRPSVSPNFNFLGQLLEYQKNLELHRHQRAQAQLQISLRKVLVPVSETEHRRSLEAECDQIFEAPAALQTPRSPKKPILPKRRSVSCPGEVLRNKDEISPNVREIPEVQQKPSLQLGENRKRQVTEPAETFEAVPVELAPGDKSFTPGDEPVARPRGFGALKSRRMMLIPTTVAEDLPSPSTELSSLAFCSLSTPNREMPPTPFPEYCEPWRCEQSSTDSPMKDNPFTLPFQSTGRSTRPCAIMQQVQIHSAAGSQPAATTFVSNPLFADIPMDTNECQPVAATHQRTPQKTGKSDAPDEKKPTASGLILDTAALPASDTWRTPLLRQMSSSYHESTSLWSAENPLFSGATRKKRGFRFGQTKHRQPPPSKVQTTDKAPQSAVGETSKGSATSLSFSERFRSLLDRAKWPSAHVFGAAVTGVCSQPLMAGVNLFGAGCFTMGASPERRVVEATPLARSTTSANVSTLGSLSGPSKSKSEHTLDKISPFPEELESPESGFVESPTRDEIPATTAATHFARDPDRESISSASSIEIAVQ